MTQDFSDVVKLKIEKIKSSPDIAVNFVKDALLTGWTEEDIQRGFYLNGFAKEDTDVLILKGKEKLTDLLGGE